MRRIRGDCELDFEAYELVKRALEGVSEVSGNPPAALVASDAELTRPRPVRKDKRVA